MLRCVEDALKYRDDVFFYWLIPDTKDEEDLAWLPVSDHIRYIKMDYFEDRYKEYWHASEKYRRLISFSGELWDIDIVLTNRTHLVPFIKWSLHRPQDVLKWSKHVVLIEDMPIMSFKMFIAMSTDREGDLATLLGYLSANKTCISAYWEKRHILKIGRDFLSAASLKYLSDTIMESCSHKGAPKLKPPEVIARTVNKEKKFTISYAGRMVNRDFVDDSLDILLKSWIIGGDNVRMILCTVSDGFGRVGHDAINYIEFMRPNREEFWRIMREDSDIGVFMSRDEDYSMAMMEPLMNGTPLVLHRSEHAVASVGEEYPFFVNTTTEGFSIIRQFREDYAKMYKRFSEWSTQHFAPLLLRREKDYLPDRVIESMKNWQQVMESANETTTKNAIVKLIAERVGDEPFNLITEMKKLEKDKSIKYNITSKTEDQFDSLRLVFSTHFDVFRVGLLKRGFKDASTIPGDMVRA